MQATAFVKAEKQLVDIVPGKGRVYAVRYLAVDLRQPYPQYQGAKAYLYSLVWKDEAPVSFETFEEAARLVARYNDGPYAPEGGRWNEAVGTWDDLEDSDPDADGLYDGPGGIDDREDFHSDI